MTIEATVDGTVIQWRDRKRYLWIIGAIVPLIPVGMWGLHVLTGSTVVWYFGPFFLFVIVPIADLIAGRDGENPPDEVLEQLEDDRYYRWVTYLFIPAQIGGLIWGSYLLGGGTLPGIDEPLSVAAKIGLALGLGMVAGTFAAGELATWSVFGSMFLGSLGMGVALLVFAAVAPLGWVLLPVGFAITFLGSLLVVNLQLRLMDVAGDAQTLLVVG